MQATIERIEQHPVRLPYRPVPERNMDRELPHWRYLEIVEVELTDGTVGFGETLTFYTWGETTDEDVERARGGDAAALMWDDSLGAGLQMALFDAVARSLSVPIHALLGEQVHERTPLSWWCIDMPPEDWVDEAERAHAAGYTNLKVKGRPWFDLFAQMEALDDALPEDFGVDVDFNGTLLDADRGLPLLEDLEAYRQLSHVEGPIPQPDVDGNRRITEALSVPVALHYGRPDVLPMITEPMCDGFVLSGGASALRDQAAVTAAAEMPGWLQLVGSGITAAYSLHWGAVIEQATWPAINCHQLYEHDLLADPIVIEEGTAAVPDGPGLGHQIDRDALDRYACEKPEERPNPPRLVEADWPDGPTVYVAAQQVNFMIDAAMDEYFPYFAPGVETRLLPDDGTDDWRTMCETATDEPVVEDGRVL